MNEIQIFSNPQFGEIRTAMDKTGNPLFCLADICASLGISNHRNVKARLDEDDVRLVDTTDNLGRNQQVIFVTESGMYDAILRSDVEKAKPFRKWVTSEVLPTIRRHGAYATPATIESIIANPENGIKLLTALKEEREQRLLAEQKAQLEAEINKTNAPKVLFADAVAGSQSSCLIGELAKIITQNGYKIGQNRLFEWLRENGYLGTKGEYYNVPNQRYQEMGLFTVKKGVRSGNDGVMRTTLTTKVTGKGQQYFINKFLNGEP
ncbi:MAG: phage antirepressor [Muribaculaceae bacterium]|nr:phage antirepressor [Muribaculaceae bacterium]